MRARLVLKPGERAIFTERAATEGAHNSLACPPGSTLLGWAATCGPYDKFKDTFAIFHSGRVRFSNALPLLDGTPAYPMPHILVEPKHEGGGSAGGRLVPNKLRVWHPDIGDVQYDAVDNKGRKYVTKHGRVVEPRFGGRLRTATQQGRAATGQLFGYTHIEPGDSFTATIEADDAIDADDWRRLLDAFRDRTLFLGRGAGAYYGGAYYCEVVENEKDDLWPIGQVPNRLRLDGRDPTPFVRVWALSDLALLDENGAPCFAPTAAMLGLPAGGHLDPKQSPLGTRRYAPWNAHLGRRDVERQVIAAGSVLTFTYKNAVTATAVPGTVGLWQEAGLGRIWVAPEMLQVARGEPPKLPEGEAPRPPVPPAAAAARPADPLIEWAETAVAAAALREKNEAQAAKKRGRA